MSGSPIEKDHTSLLQAVIPKSVVINLPNSNKNNLEEKEVVVTKI